MVQFADAFQVSLQLPVIAQPLADRRYLCRGKADLLSAAARITDGQNPDRADTGRTIGVPARSRFAVSLVVLVTGARNGDPVSTATSWKYCEAKATVGRHAARQDAGL